VDGVRTRATRLLVGALGLAAAAVVLAACGSHAPLRDCAAPLAKAQHDLAAADAKLAAMRKTDAKLLAAFQALSAKLKAIEKKYPNHELPAPVYAQYKKIQAQSDAAYKRYSSSIDATNKMIVARNAVARRYNQAAACTP
jgi:hypothetical protein